VQLQGGIKVAMFMQRKSNRKKAGNEAEVRRVDTGQAVYMTPWFQV